MAPESNSGNPTTPETQASQFVRVPGAASGERVVVAGAAGANYQFDFNPGEANMARDGANLTFDVDGGGTVVIENFFVLGDDKQFPNFVLEDGEEYQSLALLEGAGLDVTPAAGPAASATPPGGGTNYGDDPGALIDGIDRLGDLGTFHWGRATEVPDPMIGRNVPGGGFDFGVETDANGFALISGVYEDGRPGQFLDSAAPQEPGQVKMTFTPNVDNTATSVSFDLGADSARGQFGTLDAQGHFVPGNNVNGVYTFTADQVRNGQVFFMPAQDNDDTDIYLNVSVTFVTNDGQTAVVGPRPGVIEVDSVADRPDNLDTVIDITVGDVDITLDKAKGDVINDESAKDGWIKSSSESFIDGERAPSVSVAVAVEISFSDYGENNAADQSELHYGLIEKPGSDWKCFVTDPVTGVRVEMDTITIWFDDQGNTLLPVIDPATGAPDYSVQPDNAVSSKEFFQVPVDNDDLLANSGTVTVDVEMEIPQQSGDISQQLQTGGMAWESNVSDSELNWANNIAVNLDSGNPTYLNVDVVDSRLDIKIGWASESNNDAKHIGGTSDAYQTSATDKAGATGVAADGKTNIGAPIIITLTDTDSADSADFEDPGFSSSDENVSSVSFGFADGTGSLVLRYDDGTGTMVDLVIPKGADGKYTVDDALIEGLNNNHGLNLDLDALLSGQDGGVFFKPADGIDGKDVGLSYDVTVENGDGNSVTYHGGSAVGIDAVADRPAASDLKIGHDVDDSANPAVQPGKTATVSGEAKFTDNDGSESHFIVVTLQEGYQDKGWAFTTYDSQGAAGKLDGSSLLSKDAINEYWLKQMGAPYEDMDALKTAMNGGDAHAEALYKQMLSILTPGGNTGESDSARYLLIEAYPIEGTSPLEYGVKFWVQGPTGLVDVTDLVDPDHSSTFDMTTGTLHYDVQVTAPSSGGDGSATLYTKGVTVETGDGAGDREYDYANNIAVTEGSGKPTTITVKEVTTKVTVSADQVFEGDVANKDVGGKHPDDAEGGGRIHLAHESTKASEPANSEIVKSVTISHDAGLIDPNDPASGPHGVITITVQGTQYVIPPGATLNFSYIEVNGAWVYTGLASITYPAGFDGDKLINPVVFDRNGVDFNQIDDALDLRYTPSGDSYSDKDVNITVDAVITDPGSNHTNNVDDMAQAEVDAVADKPEATKPVDADDRVDYAQKPDGTEYDAARPGDSVTLHGTITFNDLDGSEAHSILVEPSNSKQVQGQPVTAGTVSKVTISYLDENGNTVTRVYTEDDVTVTVTAPGGQQLSQETTLGDFFDVNGDGYLEFTDIPNNVPSFDVAVEVVTENNSATQGGNDRFDIAIGGRAEEGATEQAGDSHGGKEALDSNNESTTFIDLEYTVAPVTGKVKVTATGVFEGGDANQHLEGNTAVPPYNAWVDPNTADAGKITFTLPGSPANEYIARIYIEYTDTHGALKYDGTTSIPSGTIFTLNAAGTDYVSQDDTITIPRAALEDGSIRYVPTPGDNSGDNVDINFAATVVDGASGDAGVSSNMSQQQMADKGLIDSNGNPGSLTSGLDDDSVRTNLGAATDSASGVNVDAVADLPADLAVAPVVHPTDTGTGETLDFKPGDTATINITNVKFDDYTDGSEKHLLLVQGSGVGVVYDSGATDSVSVSMELPQTITIFGKDGYKQIIEVTATGATSHIEDGSGGTVPGSDHTWATGSDEYLAMTNAGSSKGSFNGYFEIPVDNNFLENHTDGGKVSAEIKVELPAGSALADDGKLSINVGAGAVDSEKSGESSITQNDKAITVDPVDVNVGKITSGLSIEMGSTRVYENGRPEWFDAENAAKGLDGKPLEGGYGYNAAGENTGFVPGAVAAGAEIVLSGLNDSEETATITFTLSSKDAPASDMGDGYMGRIVDANGNDLGEFKYDSDTNQWTCTIKVDGNDDGDPVNVYFVPGDNYLSGNIELGWTATIKDNSTGQVSEPIQQPTGPEYPVLGITVDAVAQEAELGGVTVNNDSAHEKEGVLWVGEENTKGDFTLDIKATFHDFDGSEKHYVLIQINNETGLNQAFVDALGVDFTDSANKYFTYFTQDDVDAGRCAAAELGDVKDVFYKVPVDGLITSGSDYVTVVDNGDGSKTVTVHAGMDTTLGNGQTADIITGAMTVDTDTDKADNPNTAQIGGYEEGGVWYDDSQTKSTENDTSVVFNEEVTIGMAKGSGSTGFTIGTVYENDRKDAHIGDLTKEGGTDIAISINTGTAGTSATVHDTIVGDVVTVTLTGTGTITYDGQTYTSGESFSVTGSMVNGVWTPDKPISYEPSQNVQKGAYDDSDPRLDVSYQVKDGYSGHVEDVKGSAPINMDAVAQQPDAISAAGKDDGATIVDENGNKVDEGDIMPLTVTVKFTDWDGDYSTTGDDRTTDHYVLIEAKGGWKLVDDNGDVIEYETVKNPHDGKEYFKIPMDDPRITITPGTATDSGTVTYEGSLKAPSEFMSQDTVKGENGPVKVDGNMGELSYGGMSTDNAIGNGDYEESFDNNTAFDTTGTIKVDYDNTGGGHVRVHAYENDRPLANTGDDTPQDGAELPVTANAGDVLEFTYDGNAGELWYNGSKYGSGDPVTIVDGGKVTFVPKGHDDADVNISWTGDKSGSVTVIIDAVAQQADVTGVAVDNNGYEAAVPGGSVTINVEAIIYDVDGSEDVYILVERKPGWSADAETEYVDGKTYYKFPVDENTVKGATPVDPSDPSKGYTISVDVEMNNVPSQGGKLNPTTGLEEHSLDTKVMTVDNATDDGELTSSNNRSVADGGEVKIPVSEANSSMGVAVDKSIALEGESVNGSFTLNIDQYDEITGITITVSGGAGTLVIDGTAYQVNSNGTLTLNKAQVEEIFGKSSAGKGGDSSEVDFTFTPTDYGNKDVTISATVDAKDTMSGDTDGTKAGAGIEYDATAQKPEIAGNADDAAVQIAGSVKVAIAASFEDYVRDAANSDGGFNEEHFLLIEVKANWGYGGAIEGFADQVRGSDGKMYHKIPVDEFIQKALADQSLGGTGPFQYSEGGITYTVSFDNGKAVVSAEFELSSPSAGVSKDTDFDFNYGGMAVDTPYQNGSGTDGNDKIGNDFAVNTGGSLKVTVGIAETGDVVLRPVTVDEGTYGAAGTVAHLDLGQAAGGDQASLQQELSDNHETITEVDLTFTQKVEAGTSGPVVDQVIGTLHYDGEDYEITVISITNGVATMGLFQGGVQVTIEVPDGFDFGADFYMQMAQGYYNNNTITVSTTATVKDASGDTRTESNETTITVNATADPATSITAPAVVDVEQSNVVGGHQAEITLNISGDFPDMDGSELHYFLVQLPEGASITGTPLGAGDVPADCGLTPNNGPIYRVTADEAANLKVIVNGPDHQKPFVDESVIKVVAESEERSNGDTAYSAPEDVTVDIDGNVVFNIAPEIESGKQSVDAGVDALRGKATTGDLLEGRVTDDDNDTLTITKVMWNDGTDDKTVALSGTGPWTLQGANGALTITLEGGKYSYSYEYDNTYMPNQGPAVPDSFTYEVTDNYGNTSGVELELGFKPIWVNTASVATADSHSGSIKSVYEGGITFTDKPTENDVTTLTHVNGVAIAAGEWVSDVLTRSGNNGTLYITRAAAVGGGYAYTYEYHANTTAKPGDSDRFTFQGTDEFGVLTNVATADIVMETLQYHVDANDTVDGTGILGWQDGAIITGGGGNTIQAGAGDDSITGGNSGKNIIRAGEGDDTIQAGSMGDEIYAQSGSNTINGGVGADTVYGGTEDDTIYGGGGNDLIFAGSGENYIDGGIGDDTIWGGSGSDLIYGGAGNDEIHAGGEAGTTTTIYGGEGNDQIFSGLGNDILYGGSGNDTFIWDKSSLGGDDVIKDFAYDAGDKIDIASIFGGAEGLESLLSGLDSVMGQPTAFGATSGENSIEAFFLNNTQLELTLKSGSDTQVITINTENSTFYDMQGTGDTLNADLAQQILENIIKSGS